MKKKISAKKFTTVSLSKEIVEKLQRLGNKSETYEDIVRRLIIKYNKTPTIPEDIIEDKK